MSGEREAVAAALADAALTAYSAHERIRCNVGTGGDLGLCGCICGEVLAACRPAVHERHRRDHVTDAIAAALAATAPAHDEADGLSRGRDCSGYALGASCECESADDCPLAPTAAEQVHAARAVADRDAAETLRQVRASGEGREG